uniref:Uncharacterized protein n=1 Tax=Fistulifera saprophila TaxID=880757 RepID=A0A8F0WGG8_9STRA|nr:hypothetical protein KYW68_pgp006 [Fistulifera saprophila]QWM93324.1 hypothetical protein [Fistulifera saprophila]
MNLFRVRLKKKLKRVYFLLRFRAAPRLNEIFPRPTSKTEITQSPVETDDGYTYVLSLTTTKHLQYLMDKDKTEYYGPGYPFIIVNKLTPEIIEQAIKDFAEDGGYWLKVYHFAGSSGLIDESIFDQLKAKNIEDFDELDE